jgi:DNA-binding MarR family transcriptional regulator
METKDTHKIDDIAESLLRIVPLIGRSMALQMRQTEHGLLPAHLGVLGLLLRRPHIMSELANELCVSLPSMSNSVSILADRGWVARVRDPRDRRRVLVEITDEGRAMLQEIKALTLGHLVYLLESLSDQDHDRVLDGLRALENCFGLVMDGDVDLCCG